jgi:hypothetical protein
MGNEVGTWAKQKQTSSVPRRCVEHGLCIGGRSDLHNFGFAILDLDFNQNSTA